MSTLQARRIAEQYVSKLRERKFPFSRVYLYGSFARGKAKKYSDIDLAVVVPYLKNDKEWRKKKMELWSMAPSVDVRIEPLLLERDEITVKGATILGNEVRKYGVRMD